MTSVERINTYSSLPPEQGYREASLDAHNNNNSNNNNHEEDNIEMQVVKSSEGHLQLTNLSVKYRLDLDCVLRNVTLDIPAGFKVDFTIKIIIINYYYCRLEYVVEQVVVKVQFCWLYFV